MQQTIAEMLAVPKTQIASLVKLVSSTDSEIVQEQQLKLAKAKAVLKDIFAILGLQQTKPDYFRLNSEYIFTSLQCHL